MHYYSFNIGDYNSHTNHLDEIEDLAYRRMLDWCYLHEKPLPKDIETIARSIRMRTHCDSIANVLQEFFTEEDDGYFQPRIAKEVGAYHAKSEKAKRSAEARWSKKDKSISDSDANALRTDCEGNAKQKTRNIETRNIKTRNNNIEDSQTAQEKAALTKTLTAEFESEVWDSLKVYSNNKYDGSLKQYLALRKNGYTKDEIAKCYYDLELKNRNDPAYAIQLCKVVTLTNIKQWKKDRDNHLKEENKKMAELKQIEANLREIEY